MKSRSMAKQS